MYAEVAGDFLHGVDAGLVYPRHGIAPDGVAAGEVRERLGQGPALGAWNFAKQLLRLERGRGCVPRMPRCRERPDGAVLPRCSAVRLLDQRTRCNRPARGNAPDQTDPAASPSSAKRAPTPVRASPCSCSTANLWRRGPSPRGQDSARRTALVPTGRRPVRPARP